jgi:hypothetical protein
MNRESVGFGNPRRKPQGDRRGSRRAAERPGSLVGEAQGGDPPLLRAEDIETLSRELGVTAAALSGWRDSCVEQRQC